MMAKLLRASGAFDSPHPDEQLLADFFTHQDERAFATLVRRHQRTVWSVCNRLLGNPADAEDAFQATFLVLVCRGRTLSDRGSIGGWLYRVAYRTALKARTMANKRKQRENRVAKAESTLPERDDEFELMSIVGQELDRLPKVYRMAVIVSDLDGLSRAEAAIRLGCNEGTLSARLHRGRKQLAERLSKRGIAVPALGLGTLLTLATPAQAAVSSATLELATSVAILGISNRAVSASVAALVSQSMREMTMRFTTKVLTSMILTAGLVGGTMFGWNPNPSAQVNAAPIPAAKDDAKIELSGPAYELLRSRKVLKELKCSAEQRVQIEDAFEDLAEKRPAQPFAIEINPAANNPQAIQQQIEAQIQKQAEAAQAEAKTIGMKYLSKEQLVRLGQIEVQSKGVKAFTDAKIVDALKLTDDQKKTVRKVIEELDEAQQNQVAPGIAPALPGGGAGGVVIQGFAIGGPLPDAKKRAEAVEKIVGTFTKEQESAWKKMVGDKIGFDLPPLGGFGGANIDIGGGAVAFPAIPAAPAIPAPPEKPND